MLLRLVMQQQLDVMVFVDTAKEGVGGTAYCLKGDFEPFAFRKGFPEEIQKMLEV